MYVLAQRLKWLRSKGRYGQKEVAGAIDITVSGYQKMEYGESDPKLETLIDLADFYNVSTDFLLGRDNRTEELHQMVKVINALYDEVKHADGWVIMYSHETQRLEMELMSLEEMGESESLNIRKKSLNEARNKLRQSFKNLHSARKEYGEKLIEYIELLIDLPESRPWEDSVIENLRPISIATEIEAVGSYSLNLFSEKAGLIGKYKFYGTFEESELKKKELEELLNGYEVNY